MSDDAVFFVYLHRALDSGDPFYVGKGSGDRAHSTEGRSRFWMNYVKKHGPYSVELLESELTEEQAYSIEEMYVEFFGRRCEGKGPLVNILPGGRLYDGLEPAN